jgi:hypothetical protein
LEPLPADGLADPWFRPVWEDADDDDPLPGGPPHVRPCKLPCPTASLEAGGSPRLVEATLDNSPGAINALIARKWLVLRPVRPVFPRMF